MKDQTKRNLFNTGAGLLCVFVGLVLGNLFKQAHTTDTALSSVQDTFIVEEVELTLDEHINNIVPDKLQDICRAIIWVESRGKADAVSPCGKYVGILQIGSIYVKECNRLQDSITFTMEDRFDSVKSLQMFVIYQTNHNPGHDIDRAIHLHNPTASPDYKHKVKTKLNTIY